MARNHRILFSALLVTASLSAGAAATAAETAADTASISGEAREVARWVTASGDNQARPYAIVDKKGARLLVFSRDGVLQGQSPILLGAARGDDSVPGIGERPMSAIRPEERTTPAGRFVSEPGVNTKGEDIVWVDYDAAVSMHRVRAVDPKQRRLERLASATVDDNRISYGCINIPAAFYDAQIKPVFGQAPAVVYVLPETRPVATLLQSLAGGGARRVDGAAGKS